MAARSRTAHILYTETAGAGPPLLLLSTFGCGGEAWGVAFQRSLAQQFFVLRPDWPGTGRSPPLANGALTIASLADAALGVLDEYDAQSAAVLGWGLGALVALQLASTHPGRIARLALIGAALCGSALLAQAPTVSSVCGVPAETSAEEHMLGLLGRLTSRRWRPYAELFLPQLLPHPSATLAALRGQWCALRSWDFAPLASAVSAPALLLTGEFDRLAPPALAAELAAALPAAELRTLPGAGHALVWEEPAAVLEAIVPFLSTSIHTRVPALPAFQEGGIP